MPADWQVDHHLNDATRVRVGAMVAELRTELDSRLTHAKWLSDGSRRAALEKLDAMRVDVGHPAPVDVPASVVRPSIVLGDHLGNVMRARACRHHEMLHATRVPTDARRWCDDLLPQHVNACYDVHRNAVLLPSASLQPPLLSPQGQTDLAKDWGALGAIIAHEMTHAFDGTGWMYDASGTLREMLTPDERACLEGRLAEQAALASEYVIDGQPVDGRRTSLENFADLGGLELAYGALQRCLAHSSASSAPPQHGWASAAGAAMAQLGDWWTALQAQVGGDDHWTTASTPERRFFLSWARLWRHKGTPQYMRLHMTTNSHAPHEYRCNGPLTLMPAFHGAYGVKRGERMWRSEEDCAEVCVW